MDTITLTKKQINDLTPFSIENEVKNTESRILILDKGNWNYSDGSLLLKKLFITGNEAMANKLFNVSLLKDKEEEIGIEELVIPQHLVAVRDGKKTPVIGFTVETQTDTRNLGVILNNIKISNEEKIELLYKVGALLKKTDNMKRKQIDFSFGDFHEYNILVKDNTNELRVVDIDSAYLGNNYPMASYYLSTNKNIGNLKRKYRLAQNGFIIPSKNSDLLCYNMMLLNTIAREKISSLDMAEYYSYIFYLKDLGFGNDIISSFERLYTTTSNINPCNYFDEIPLDKIPEAGYKVFKLKKEKNLI